MAERSIIRMRFESQDVAHHWVNIHGVNSALPVTFSKRRTVGSKEWMHGRQRIVVTMVTYWIKDKIMLLNICPFVTK